MPICRLCQQDRDLRQSHIFSEFLFRELYDDDRRMMGVTGTGPRGWRYLQRGMAFLGVGPAQAIDGFLGVGVIFPRFRGPLTRD